MAHFWIQIVGSKDVGKTSLLENVTRELARRGRSVCYVKHTHQEIPTEPADTDTSRLAAAGARVAVLAGPSTTASFRAGGKERIEAISFREVLPGEIVLAEGFKGLPGAKIAIPGGDLDIESLEGVAAVVGEAPPGFRGRTFSADDTEAICDLIEELSSQPADQRWSTRLLVDGKELPLNGFVQGVIGSTLAGMCAALREGDVEETIEIRCRITRRERPTG